MGKRASRKVKTPVVLAEGTGNVFADRVPNPEEALARAKLAHSIRMQIDAAGLDQAAAAERLGIDQPKVSALKRGRLEGFSMERLMRFLTLLGNDVQIQVERHQGGGTPQIHVREDAALT